MWTRWEGPFVSYFALCNFAGSTLTFPMDVFWRQKSSSLWPCRPCGAKITWWWFSFCLHPFRNKNHESWVHSPRLFKRQVKMPQSEISTISHVTSNCPIHIFSPGWCCCPHQAARPAAWGICLFVFAPPLGTGEAKETPNDIRLTHLQHKTWLLGLFQGRGSSSGGEGRLLFWLGNPQQGRMGYPVKGIQPEFEPCLWCVLAVFSINQLPSSPEKGNSEKERTPMGWNWFNKINNLDYKFI